MIANYETHFDCPFCGSKNTIEIHSGSYRCQTCLADFDINDVILEPIRHKLSAICAGHTEDNPLPCDITIGDLEPYGTEVIERPSVCGIFETQDGVLYFMVQTAFGPMCIEFDSMPLGDLVTIADNINA